tara:strand:- start:405 stop:989 length:585 start_codon:yes stop_codon:yes gene_type:complete
MDSVKKQKIYQTRDIRFDPWMMNPLLTLLIYIASAAALGSLMLLSGIPAAPLLGSILAGGCLSVSGQLDPAQWPVGTKTLLGIGVGTVIGTGINRNTLAELQTLWKPALLITISLILTGLFVGFLVVRLFGIDPLIALLGSAPGGTLGMSLVGAELGVGAAVAAIHAFRLITVLLIIPAVVKYLAPLTGINVNQ